MTQSNSSSVGWRGTIKNMPRSIIIRIFSVVYVLLALMMLVPPFYAWAGRLHPIIFWLPFSVFYVVLNALLITLLIWLLWIVEGIRGEQEVFDSDEVSSHGK